MYIGFKTSFYVVRHLDSIASYLPTGLHLGFFFLEFFFPGDGVLAHRPNPQPGGPVYLSLSGCSPLTCLASVALPVATLPPA